MRTTLDIDEDVINAAKELARRDKLSTGQVVSRLLREVLTRRHDEQAQGRTVAGFRPFAPGGRIVSNDEINVLRDAEGV